MSRLLGIDYGTKRIGLALSDETRSLAFPSEVVPADPNLFAHIQNVVEANNVTGVVVGDTCAPGNLPNAVTERLSMFVEELRARTGLSVVLVPEAYTSLEARRQFEQKERDRKPMSKKVVDASAAALMLQHYLDRTQNA